MEGKSIGQVYTLDAKMAKGNKDLIGGTCYVNNQPLLFIIYSGASHSFISTKCVQQLGLEVVSLSSHMVISIATHDIVET